MEKVKKILVATDFSPFSQEAVDYAVYLTQELKGELFLVYVYQEPLTLPSAGTFDAKDRMDIVDRRGKGNIAPEITQWMVDFRESEKKRFTAFVETLRSKVEKITPIFKTGIPFDEIIKTADENKADLLVLGTHGRTGMVHFLMGSVAEKVVRQSPCPVLTVRPKEIVGKFVKLKEQGGRG